MGDTVSKLVEWLLNLIKKHYRNPKLWVSLIIILVVILLLVPYIDSNFFYYSRMEKRIDILKSLTELDSDIINGREEFKQEYESLLLEMQQQRERTFYSIVETAGEFISDKFNVKYEAGSKVWKFVSGAFWMLILTGWSLFTKTIKGFGNRIATIAILLAFAGLLGMIAVWIPIIISPYVNYFGVPILQLVLIIIISVKSSSQKTGA